MKKRALASVSSDTAFQIVVDILLAIIGLVTLYPLLFVVSASISDPNLVATGNVILLPKGIDFSGYRLIFTNENIVTGYRNSLYYTVVGTILNLIVTFSAAYGLSRRELPGRTVINVILAITMWFGGGLIPTYLVVLGLNLVNTPYTLLIIGLFSVYNMLICRSFINSSIPEELQEAARIDGADYFRIFFRIITPLSTPVIAVIAMYYAIGHWNDYFTALIYLNDRKYMPLQIFLREILIENQSMSFSMNDIKAIRSALERAQIARVMKYGLCVVGSLPMLLLYPFVQRYFVKGVMIGAIKG